MLSARQGGIKYYFFESLVWLDLEIEPQSPGRLANTLLIRPMAQLIDDYYYYYYYYYYQIGILENIIVFKSFVFDKHIW